MNISLPATQEREGGIFSKSISVERARVRSQILSVSAVDSVNLVGIRAPAIASNRVLYLDGVPVAALRGNDVRLADDITPSQAWEMRKALLRRPSAARV